MSEEKLIDNELEKTSNSDVHLEFIALPQFIALNQRFEGILEGMEDDDSLQSLRSEFLKLLQAFQACYRENERKTRKIFELRALNKIQIPEAESVNSEQQATVRNLKEAISHLQKNLDDSNEQRKELSDEINALKKTIDTQNKLIQVHAESLENLREEKNESDFGLTSELETSDKVIIPPETGMVYPAEKTILENGGLKTVEKVTDFKVLRNNLEITVAGLKLAREKIEDLKKEILVKDSFVKDVRNDLLAAEELLMESENKFKKLKEPMEIELDITKLELERSKQKLKDTSAELEKALDLNASLTKDISYKDSIIEDLKMKVKGLDLAKESALRKVDIFEKNLAENHCYVEKMKREAEALKDELMTFEKQSPMEISQKTLHVDRETLNYNALERTIETLKHRVTLGNNKIELIREELKTTVGILHSSKKDFSVLKKEKNCLESEIQDVKKALKERNDDIKRLKEQLKAYEKEIVELKRELQVQTKKHQQATEKKNKFHSLCNHLKTMNSQQRKENVILGKRQEYLVKILKEKDMEIERVVSWKRHFP